MKSLTIAGSILVLGMLIPNCKTNASTVAYTNSAAFAAATTNPTTVGFNAILPPGFLFQGFNPLTVSGIVFSTPTPNTVVNVTTNNFYSPNDYPADFIVDSANPSTTNELVISLPTPVHALALDYGGLGFSGPGSATIALSNGYVFTPAALVMVGNTQFAGFVSNDLITGLMLVTTNDSWVVEDFTTSSPVPEPSALALLSGGILILSLIRRRQR